MNRIYCSTSVRCGSSRSQAFSDIAAAGFTEIDLLAIEGWVHINPSEMQERNLWREELTQHGLTVRALNTGVGPQLHDRSETANSTRTTETRSLLDYMKDAGVSVAAIQPRAKDESREWEDVLQDCIASVREQVEMASADGISFALELHVNSPFESIDQAKRLLEEWPDVPLIYDPSHFIMQGIPLQETRWLMKNAKHCHVRDCARGRLQAPFGDGEVDFKWVVNTLGEEGFQGAFSIEYLESKDFDAIESAQKLRDHLVNLGID